MKPGSPLWNRLFGQKVAEDKAAMDEAEGRKAAILELVSRHGFRTEVIDWLEAEIKKARVVAGAQEDMLVRVGFRDGIEHVLDRMKALQDAAKES